MTLSQERVDAALAALLSRLEKQEPGEKSSPAFWALRASRQHPLPGGGLDRGIFSIYLLNLVHLEPGEGTYQPAGLPHAHLEGTTVELMTNSDNVLRGGLTGKKVDVPELLRTLDFTAGKPSILRPRPVSAVEGVYPAPTREFRLSRLSLLPGQAFGCSRHGPDCLLTVQGAAELDCAGRRLELSRGTAILVPAGLPYTLRSAGNAAALMYRASVP
jgi:mannose-6-phosphate isomerase class I